MTEPELRRIDFHNAEALADVCGESNKRLKLIGRKTGTHLYVRGTEVRIEGDDVAVELAKGALEQLYDFAVRGQPLDSDDVVRAIQVLTADGNVDLRSIFSDTILVPAKGRPITPKGVRQKLYVDLIREKDIVFGIGPAGTGKTFLAMAMAVRALKDRQVKRIVLTRPAVEAGERLGFLPGTLEEKISPYLRPLYDALFDMMDFEQSKRLIEQEVIEVAPLAFMRGRTLNDAFVILDEAQNTTREQMKMFLTRLGFGSQAVITGDITQSDLPYDKPSGMRDAMRLFSHINGIGFCHFTRDDVVRHPLVMQIIKAYEKIEHHRDERPRDDAPESSE